MISESVTVQYQTLFSFLARKYFLLVFCSLFILIIYCLLRKTCYASLIDDGSCDKFATSHWEKERASVHVCKKKCVCVQILRICNYVYVNSAFFLFLEHYYETPSSKILFLFFEYPFVTIKWQLWQICIELRKLLRKKPMEQ